MPKRILVVDDDRNIGQILHASFSSKGYETIVSRNGEDALTKFSQVNPDMVLLDILLPKMNGWEVCRRLKETDAGKKTPVILMSAVYKNFKVQQEARDKYGADGFVEKPFQLSRLLDQVEEMLGPGDPDALAVEGEEDVTGAQATAAVETKKKTYISLEGELTTISFAELLHAVYVMGKSGYLLVRHGDVEKEIAVKDGYPVSVRTTLEDEYFGNFLVKKRKISPEQRDASVERMKSSNRLQGTILIEMGALTPHELVKFLRLQMREKIFEIFGWSEGIYKFTENADVQGDITTLDMSTANVVNEGVQQHYDIDRLLPTIDEWRGKFLRPGTNLHYRYQDLELTRRENAVFEEIDGMRTLGDVLSALDIDSERAYQLVYTLVTCEMIELADAPLEKPETAERPMAREPEKKEAFVEEPEEQEEEETKDDDRLLLDEEPEEDDADADFEFEKPAKPTPAAKAAPAKPAPAAKDEEKPGEEDVLGDDEEGLRKKVLRVYNRINQGNFFQVLGVGENPTEHEVRVSYHRMAKDFHPDRFFGKASPEVKSQVEEIFRMAAKAYEALNTQEKITLYKKQLESDEEGGPRTDVRIEGVKKIIMAEQHFQNGKQYLKEKRYARAAHEFRQAIDVSPNEAEYISYYGWAMYNIPFETDISEEDKKLFPETSADLQFNGREALNRAISVNPRAERAYLFLGSIYKKQGLKEFAEKQYEKALICNPNCIEALRELRLIKLEEQKKTKKKSFFERLLGH